MTFGTHPLADHAVTGVGGPVSDVLGGETLGLAIERITVWFCVCVALSYLMKLATCTL